MCCKMGELRGGILNKIIPKNIDELFLNGGYVTSEN